MYQIKDWDKHYENAGSRKIEHCSWCPIPNKQDGLGYALLIQGKTGATLYAAFVATVLSCSKQPIPRNGWLTDDGSETGRPLTAYDLHLKTKLPENEIAEMLERASKPDIGWIIKHSPSIDSIAVADYQHTIDITEQKEQKEQKEDLAATSVPATFIELARTFLEKQKERFPKESALLKDFEDRVTVGAHKLHLFRTSDDWTEDEIRDLLDWVLEDEFWCMQIRTLGGIRNRKAGKGSAMKFENARAAMERSPKEQSVMEMLEKIEDESKTTD